MRVMVEGTPHARWAPACMLYSSSSCCCSPAIFGRVLSLPTTPVTAASAAAAAAAAAVATTCRRCTADLVVAVDASIGTTPAAAAARPPSGSAAVPAHPPPTPRALRGRWLPAPTGGCHDDGPCPTTAATSPHIGGGVDCRRRGRGTSHGRGVGEGATQLPRSRPPRTPWRPACSARRALYQERALFLLLCFMLVQESFVRGWVALARGWSGPMASGRGRGHPPWWVLDI